jgi:hypothetical protein
VINALQDLPDDIGLLNPRVVVPVMLAIRVPRRLNVLSAVPLLVDGDLQVTTDAPILRAGTAELGVHYDVVA